MSDEIQNAIDLLETISQNPSRLVDLTEAQRVAIFRAAGRISRPNRLEIRIRNRAIELARHQKVKKHDRGARAATGIREARQAAVFQAPLQITASAQSAPRAVLQTPNNCYVCKSDYTELHHFYDSMCIECGDFNYQKRFQTAPLTGQVALITGARLKIGYQSALLMLRAGARVIVSTRFPVDAALRFSRETDFDVWSNRLQVHGLDLRHTPSVELFARFIEKTYDRLDILINNAAQTVRRPPGFYAHLIPQESVRFDSLPLGARKILQEQEDCRSQLNHLCGTLPMAQDSAPLVAWSNQAPGLGLRASAQLSQIPYTYDSSIKVEEVFPEGKLDADLQQVDLRSMNSWRMKLADVPSPEMLEVQLVNAVAPFVLCSRLAPLMRRDKTGMKHIVNVSAMEGKFNRFTKTDRHPHTNMAKAALNMLTLTSAADLATDGIFMNAVDTGWVTDEDPAAITQHKQEMHDFHPPLDIVDGAARVCDPFFNGILTGQHLSGKFLKDYKPTDW